MHLWELAALFGGLVLWRAAPRLPQHLRQLWAAPAMEWVFLALALVLTAAPLWLGWARLAPERAPMGPDANAWMGSALAFETGRWSLYYEDRYPGWPWLVAAVSPDPLSLPRAGVALNMALTMACALPLYAIGRLLSGRCAGLLGAVVALRLPVALDVGRSFTAYPLLALLDLSIVAALLALGAAGWRGRLALAIGIAGAAGLAIASDPKQIPLALGACALLALAGLSRGHPALRLALVALALAPLPAAHWLVGRYQLGLLSLEGATVRTPVNLLDRGLWAQVEGGFALGEPGALGQLVPSFLRVAASVGPKDGGPLDPAFLSGLPMLFQQTGPVWLLALLALPLLLRRSAAALLALALFASAAIPSMRVHYAHRYALPHAMAAPVLVLTAVERVAGAPAALWVGLAALAGPARRVDAAYLALQSPDSDLWVGSEKPIDVRTLDWAAENLPKNATIYDFAEMRTTPILAAAFPYQRCAMSPTHCGAELRADPGARVALVRARETLSAELPSSPREPIVPDGYGRMPKALGDCWTHLYMPGPNTAFYQWTCEEPPAPWPDLRQPPRGQAFTGQP